MTRYRITIEYDGTDFVGWQRQENGPSVQQAIEEAVEKFSGERVTVFGAGRTDSGVHAKGQVAHFDLERHTSADEVQGALNYHLKPAPISILEAAEAAPDFHAQKSAVERRYAYRIINRRAPLALERNRAWHVSKPLDAGAMHNAAQMLVGKFDFTTFRAAFCQAKSPIKTLAALDVERTGAKDEDILIHARAPSFLHHQVRNFAGTLKLVGEGKWTPEDVRAALEAKDRAHGGPTAPACGLYLVEVRYG